jgi:hypothetical protein
MALDTKPYEQMRMYKKKGMNLPSVDIHFY